MQFIAERRPVCRGRTTRPALPLYARLGCRCLAWFTGAVCGRGSQPSTEPRHRLGPTYWPRLARQKSASSTPGKRTSGARCYTPRPGCGAPLTSKITASDSSRRRRRNVAGERGEWRAFSDR